MDARQLPIPAARRTARSPIVLGDLLWLVGGSALAFALPWMSPLNRTVGWSAARPVPVWYSLCVFAGEVLGKACLALTPLLLARRARRGEPLRAIEYLAVVCAAPMLPRLMDYAGALIYVQSPISAMNGSTTLVLDPTSWSILLRIWGLGALALGALAIGRTLASWVRSGLLVTFLLTSYSWAVGPLESAVHRLTVRAGYPDPPIALALVFEFTTSLIVNLVPGIVAAAALRDRLARPAAVDVMETGVLLIAAVIFVLGQATNLGETCNGGLPSPSEVPILAILLSFPWISLAAGWGIVKVIDPAWSRGRGASRGSNAATI